MITTDLAGPFKETIRGNKHYLVIDCCFSKYIQLHALPNIKAETVADKIVDGWCCTFGIPETILADGGKQYQSKLMELIYEYLDIRAFKTTAFHPSGNGLSERNVQTTKNMIKAHVDEEQGDWDLHLNKFAYAYNSAIQESTKQTPFEMMFGRKPKIPMDIVLPNHNGVDNQVNERQPEQDNENLGEVTILEEQTSTNIPQEASQYLEQLKKRMEESHSKAALNRNTAMDKHKLF